MDAPAIAGCAALAYFLLVADVSSREPGAALEALTAVMAGAVIAAFVLRSAGSGDQFDRVLVVALVLFAVCGILSDFPRQALDSVLAALLCVAAVWVGRGISARESGRRLIVLTLTFASAILTLLSAAQFVTPFVEWWALTEWTVFPPLELHLVAEPWGYRHDIALLLVVLYPSWWIGKATRLRIVAATTIGLLVAVVVLIDGSRTVWFATLAASAALVFSMARRSIAHARTGWIVPVSLIATAIVAALVATGSIGTFGDRLLRFNPIQQRASMWGALLETWLSEPWFGTGPGSFPWILQGAGYFDTNSLAPRHPDSAVIQLLVEGGVVGLIAGGTVAIATVRKLIACGSGAAVFAITALLCATVTLNPTQLAFLMAAAVAWAAVAIPRHPRLESRSGTRGARLLRNASLAVTGLIGLAVCILLTGGFAYAIARSHVHRGEFEAAEAPLRIAESLDPALALYPRELGTLQLVLQRPEQAIRSLTDAASINPNDDLTWRLLGIAYRNSGDDTKYLEAMRQAVAVQRSDPNNLLLLGRAMSEASESGSEAAILAEVVAAWPLIVASPGWRDWVSPSALPAILRSARARWESGLPSPQPLADQPLLIDVMLGRGEAEMNRELSSMSETLQKAYIAVMRCDRDAESALTDVTDTDRRQETFWALSIRQASVAGGDRARFQRLHRIMTGSSSLLQPLHTQLNPLQHYGGAGARPDEWAYQREPIYWPPALGELPSPDAGRARWYLNPMAATAEAGLENLLKQCTSGAH